MSLSPDVLCLGVSLTPCTTLYLTPFFLSAVPFFCRSKRSSVPITEFIFELPHFTVQATRAQTLLLQVIGQSWTHSTINGTASTLSESLLNEVYRARGKRHSPVDYMEYTEQSSFRKLQG